MEFEGYIEGPISLFEASSAKYDKIIYVFGERHNISTCSHENKIGIGEFLADWIDGSGNVIDLFLELEYIDIKRPSRREYEYSGISDIADWFEDCFELEKNCRFSNLRAHYVDIRHSYSAIKIYREFFDKIEEIIVSLFNLDQADELRINNEIHNLSPDLIDIGNQLFPLKSHSNKIAKVWKQIYKVEYSEIRAKLIVMFDILIYDINSAWEIIKKNLVDFEENYPYITYKKFNNNGLDILKNYGKVFTIQSRLMDIYLLARMFRKFSDGSEPKNIIIYVGHAHAERYYNFLKEAGFKIGPSIYSETPCVNINYFNPLKF